MSGGSIQQNPVTLEGTLSVTTNAGSINVGQTNTNTGQIPGYTSTGTATSGRSTTQDQQQRWMPWRNRADYLEPNAPNHGGVFRLVFGAFFGHFFCVINVSS